MRDGVPSALRSSGACAATVSKNSSSNWTMRLGGGASARAQLGGAGDEARLFVGVEFVP
jgi:hypothetical protein